jgi:hypothetical protein
MVAFTHTFWSTKNKKRSLIHWLMLPKLQKKIATSPAGVTYQPYDKTQHKNINRCVHNPRTQNKKNTHTYHAVSPHTWPVKLECSCNAARPAWGESVHNFFSIGWLFWWLLLMLIFIFSLPHKTWAPGGDHHRPRLERGCVCSMDSLQNKHQKNPSFPPCDLLFTTSHVCKKKKKKREGQFFWYFFLKT